jgi:hypothetical protein
MNKLYLLKVTNITDIELYWLNLVPPKTSVLYAIICEPDTFARYLMRDWKQSDHEFKKEIVPISCGRKLFGKQLDEVRSGRDFQFDWPTKE